MDPNLARIEKAWPAMPEAVQQALVEAAEGMADGSLDEAAARALLAAARSGTDHSG